MPIPELAEYGVGDEDLIATRALAVIRELLPIPRAELGPPDWAITGFDNHLWYSDDGRLDLTDVDHDGDPATPPRRGATVEASDGPYTIAATVWIDQYVWRFSNGDVETGTRPGTSDDPSAVWNPRTADPDNTVTAETRWRGTFTWTAPGLSGEGDMGSLTITADPQPWPVREIRAVLTEPSHD